MPDSNLVSNNSDNIDQSNDYIRRPELPQQLAVQLLSEWSSIFGNNRTEPRQAGVEVARPKEGERPPEAPPALTDRETRLVETMRARGATEAELNTFRQDLITLRGRGLSAAEVSRTLDQVDRLMASRGDSPTSQDDRRRIGMQIIHHAAHPQNIDQGYHNTCNVTTLEERLFTRTPSIAAEMIVSAATTGQWRAPDGRVIQLNTGAGISFVPGREESATYPADGQRSFASQIFQVTAVNDATQRRNPPQFYRQDMTVANSRDTGERMYTADNQAVMRNGRRVTSPTLSNNEIAQIGRRLTGDTGYFLSPPGQGGDSTREIRTHADLVAAVQDLQRRGQLPATLFVDANYPGLGGSGLPRNYGQWHVVSITGYDPRTGQMQVSNQWGSAHDRQIHSNDLFHAMGGWPRR